MLSYWERESFIKYDYAVIGAGIVGLSTAISIKEKDPKASVIIFEKGILPTGASTKNAGFACFGSLTELINDIEEIGEEKSLELVKERNEGLNALRRRLGDKAIRYEGNGGYELIQEEDIGYVEKMDKINKWLSPLFSQDVFEIKDAMIDKFGFSRTHVSSLIFNQYEGQIHTGEMMKNLLLLAQKLSITMITGAEVKSIEDHGNSVSIEIKNIGQLESIMYSSAKVAICTNAFTKSLIPDLELLPGRGIVLVTKPIENLNFNSCFHIEQGYYYFRNIDHRILFGGGRNLYFDEETTHDFEINAKIIRELEKRLAEVIIPNTSFEV
ncbi:MAG: FAD-dependent oxidoreductase, partial [Bacteroidota bacterium]